MSNIRSSRNGSRWDEIRTAARLDQRRCSTTKLPCWELRPFQRECRGRVQQPITQWLGSCYDRCLFAHLPNYHSGFQPDILHTLCVYACEYKWVPPVFFMANFLWRNAASQCASSLCIFFSPVYFWWLVSNNFYQICLRFFLYVLRPVVLFSSNNNMLTRRRTGNKNSDDTVLAFLILVSKNPNLTKLT